MSKLLDDQITFCFNLAKLIQWGFAANYRIKFGEVHRPAETAKLYESQGRGISNSLHTKSLAADLHLFTQENDYLTKTEDYALLGHQWKTMHPRNRWGGDFKRLKDGNHFSMEYEGVQ